MSEAVRAELQTFPTVNLTNEPPLKLSTSAGLQEASDDGLGEKEGWGEVEGMGGGGGGKGK